MKRRIVLVIVFSLLLIINAIGLYLNYFASKDIIINNSNISKNNALTMMLETDVDSNEYEVATSNTWPDSGYIFNESMSACERGGELTWDASTSQVVMESNNNDK